MDLLFGEVERTDLEKAVEGYGEPKKDVGSATHLEHAGFANAVANGNRTNEVEVMGVINEDQGHYRRS